MHEQKPTHRQRAASHCRQNRPVGENHVTPKRRYPFPKPVGASPKRPILQVDPAVIVGQVQDRHIGDDTRHQNSQRDADEDMFLSYAV